MRKRIILSFFAILLFSSLVANVAFAEGTVSQTNGENVVVQSSVVETPTNRLGKINASTVRIYSDLNNLNQYRTAGSAYADHVYYIDKQATVNNTIYYSINTEPTSGVVGWVKSSDLTSYSYEVTSENTFTLYLKGTGWAYTDPWGGDKDATFKSLTTYKGQPFKVTQTMDVGGNNWYRGTISGKTVYIHANNVTKATESSTSRLGKFKNQSGKIYQDITDFNHYTTIGSGYADYVYYIKKQVTINDQTYYLISRKPSATEGIVGWVNANDLTTNPYEETSTETFTLYLTGSGWAYTEPWGGNVDAIFKSLTAYQGQPFQVTQTLNIANNNWYRGTINGKTVYIHSNNVVSIQESSTSQLGKYKNKDVRIYQNLASLSSYKTAGTGYADHVYYIKKQATRNGVTYYLLSTKPSATEGIVGWVKASDLTTNPYEEKSNQTFTLYLTGTGWAYSQPWGGNKDAIFKNLTSYGGNKFQVTQTLDIGNNDWYRGTINGQTVYIHSNNVVSIEESAVNRLGKYKNKDVRIYQNLATLSSYTTAGTGYADHVYYIKKQASRNGVIYYLLSTKPSATEGVVGWVKASDLTSNPYEEKNNQSFTLYLTGTGWAYTQPWGGNTDAIFKDLTSYKGQAFQVTQTLDIGNNDWYRGTINGQTVYIHSNNVATVYETSVSRLGKYTNANVRIYRNLTDQNTFTIAGSGYADYVYYIQSQAKYNGATYYLLSREPSTTQGVVGWVKASDITSYEYKVISSERKTLYLTGSGWAYTEPWGGNMDATFKNLSGYINQAFPIDQVLDIGNNTWYRGKINGQTVYIHSNNVKNTVESSVTRLGKFKNATAKIYGNLNNLGSYSVVGSNYGDHVYYINKQAKLNEENYYLLSREPNIMIGWVKASDLTSYSLTTVSGSQKVFYLKGTGWAYTDPWGGEKDVVFTNLTNDQGDVFIADLTLDVGGNTWYRGKINGVTVYIHSNNVGADSIINKAYDVKLSEALAMQMSLTLKPQTDQNYAYVSKDYIVNGRVVLTSGTLNVRTGPGGQYKAIGSLKNGDIVRVIATAGDWYAIEFNHNTWVDAIQADVLYYLNPLNFINDPIQRFQFLDLAQPSDATVSQLNAYLAGKGILSNMGQAFIDAANQNGINDLYLISHAVLETGNGKSPLANGVMYNGVKVYNMYGIGAVDGDAENGGAKTAYENGWTTPYKAIVGGARFIGTNYIKAGQNTIYEMRWNPAGMEKYGYATHQYASDIGWASKQLSTMYNLYQQLGIINVKLEIPVYKAE
ncbi:GW dipeptide domain-containing protein [Caldibacillus lycopersici]|uniref:GW dipeptide domain-containing protein n=1 Tax=Perspicuibacillus lycopersici TaxID=1325689 RepID=A0AAE3ITN6_9BACI|nr:GW dipeptide domain-containing protein [Perspicuibacillus lycopersici]MCU9613266.1 GW dipeptide domain-containing protein [Perspicuibacillus lycopersici]